MSRCGRWSVKPRRNAICSNSYLAKYRETTARDSIAAAPADARIISTAVVSNIPYFPKKMPITLIAALGTFCLSMAFVVTAALLNSDNYRAARRKTDSEPEFAPAEGTNDAGTLHRGFLAHRAGRF